MVRGQARFQLFLHEDEEVLTILQIVLQKKSGRILERGIGSQGLPLGSSGGPASQPPRPSLAVAPRTKAGPAPLL